MKSSLTENAEETYTASHYNHHKASIYRHFAAILYDAIVIFALLLLATLAMVSLQHGKAIAPNTHWYQCTLLAIIMGYYVGFWNKRGQTLGMLAWRIRLVDHNDLKAIRLTQAICRFIYAVISIACFGIGLVWMLFDKEHISLYDRLAKTRLIQYDVCE